MNRFENGLDSFKKAILGLRQREEDEYALKEVVMNFHHSIEVLLKHILFLKDKVLIYQDMDAWIEKNFQARLGNKEAQNKGEKSDYTITFEETVRRVVVAYEIPLDRDMYRCFLRLNTLRNGLTHDEVELDREEVEQVVVTLIPVVTELFQNYLTQEQGKEFMDFLDSSECGGILSNLYKYNLRWRLITITKLLGLYTGRPYDKLTVAEKLHISKMLGILGAYVNEDEFGLDMDDRYYITLFACLKQMLCDNLLGCKADILRQLREDIGDRAILEKTLLEYLENAAFSICNLMELGGRCVVDKEFLEDAGRVGRFLNHSSLTNANDIYQLLFCMKRIADVAVEVTGAEKRDAVLERCSLGGDGSVTLKLFYHSLLGWYADHGWYNAGNKKGLTERERAVFFEDDAFLSDAAEKMWYEEIYNDFIGEYGNWGTIDRVDDCEAVEIAAVVRSEGYYSVVVDAVFDTQTYYDHEYFSDGSKEAYVRIDGVIGEDGTFEMTDMEYMGDAVGFESFCFR